MRDETCERLGSHVAAVAGIAGVIAFTALGAGVVLGRRLVDVLSRLLTLGPDQRMPRHNVGMVREQVRAAERAARAAGVFRGGGARR
jgi:hypothetical protein